MKTLFSLLLITSLYSCSQQKSNVPEKKIVIGIQTFGEFDSVIIDTISKTIQEVYGFEVKILERKEMPKSAYVNIKSPRYRADSLLKVLKREKPTGIHYVLGLTEKDISTTKWDYSTTPKTVKKPQNGKNYKDWGIFGLGYMPGSSCVVSTYRIKNVSAAKFMERLKKICIHELGHNLGLKHCEEGKRCVMRDAAESVKTVDNVDLELCPHCKDQITP